MLLKEKKFCVKKECNLSSLDENERRKAVDEMLKCIDASKAAKVATVLVTSGARPENELQKEEGLLVFQDSLEEICTYAGKDITITIEPGDSNVNYFQLIGPTAQAAALMRQMVGRGIGNLALTMDISHLAMLGEEITPSLEEVIPYCSHIHLANCILG